MQKKGKITFWNDKKGYGFIEPNSGEKRVFVHIHSFRNHGQRPEINQVVSYSLSKDKQGRPCAVNVLRAGEKPPRKRKRFGKFLLVPLALAFLLFVGKLALANVIPAEVLYAYLGISLLTGGLYKWDKSAAQKGNWRRKESTLHALALVGGWPGALIAQQTLRHKSSKGSFQFVFWVTVVVNCGAFVWFFVPGGEAQMRSWIDSIEQVLSTLGS